jgi:FtsZ-binding cell division protein ZapB
MVQPLLDIAAELEARDERVADALVAIEELQAEVDEIRAQAAAVSAFLAALPAALASHAEDEERAESDRLAAQARLREAETQKESPLRDLAVHRAKDAILDADRRADRAREHQAALTLEGTEHTAEAARLQQRAQALHGRLRDVDPPAAGLDATIAWASQARGALIVEHSGLARQREDVVREASELLGSVLGDPLAATSVAGLRDRLARALP